jgi:outer membrane protein TolC
MKQHLVGSLIFSLMLSPANIFSEDDADASAVENDTMGQESAGDPDDDVATKLVKAVLTASQRAVLGKDGNLQEAAISICRKIVTKTVQNSKDLRMSRCDVIKGLGDGKNAIAEIFPDVSISADVTATHTSGSTETNTHQLNLDKNVTKDSVDGPGVSMNINQVLFNGGASLAAIKQTSYEAKSAYAAYKVKESAAIEKMLKLAFDIITQRLLLRYSEITVTVCKEILKSELGKLNVGEVDRSEVASAEGQVAKSETKAAEARSKLTAIEGDLFRFTGVSADDLPLMFPDLAKMVPLTLEQVQNTVAKENPQLLAGHFATLASQAAIRRVKARYFPVVSLKLDTGVRKNFNYEKEENKQQLGATNSTTAHNVMGKAAITLSVSMPLDFKGSNHVAADGAHQDLVKMKINEAKIAGDIKSDAETYVANIRHRKDIVDACKRQVKAAMIQLQASLQELSVGAKVYTQVLKAQSNVLDAQEAYVLAESAYVETILHLLALMGKLDSRAFGADAFDFNAQTAATYKDCDDNDSNDDMSTSANKIEIKSVTNEQYAPKIYPAKVGMRPIV